MKLKIETKQTILCEDCGASEESLGRLTLFEKMMREKGWKIRFKKTVCKECGGRNKKLKGEQENEDSN